jgi:hypothetical protein
MKMIEIVNKFEKMVYAVLMALLMLVLVGSLLDLIWLLYKALISLPCSVPSCWC